MSNEELVLLIQKGDFPKEHLEELYLKNIGFIRQIALKYKGYADIDDLMQEGYLGLYEACKRWDSEHDVKFITYAQYWIQNKIHRYINSKGSAVRLPEYRLELLNRYKQLINTYALTSAHSLSDKELMCALDISYLELQELKREYSLITIKSLDEPLNGDTLDTLGDTIKDSNNAYSEVENEIQNQELSSVLWDIVDNLNFEQSEVLHKRYKLRCSTEAIANELNISKARVRTLESHAIRELRRPKNSKLLRPFLTDDLSRSISLAYSGYQRFKNTWTSSEEWAVLLDEEKRLKA